MFGEKVKQARKDAGLSQEGLARLCGLSRETIRRIETETINPSIDVCSRIAKQLNKTIDELFTEKTSA